MADATEKDPARVSDFRPHPWHGLEVGPDLPEIFNAYIEITPFDLMKYEVDKVSAYLRVDRPQRSSAQHQALYGFVPRTCCDERVRRLSPGARRGDGVRAAMADYDDNFSLWMELDVADPYDLDRSVAAQERDYADALAEITSGRKRTHWMWYVFPQFEGLGFSATSKRYAIKNLAEARAYLAHAVLGPRLTECAEAALGVERRSAYEIFGSPDDMKLKSCATLFACVSPPGSVFHRLLDKYFQGERDEKTLRLLELVGEGKGTDQSDASEKTAILSSTVACIASTAAPRSFVTS